MLLLSLLPFFVHTKLSSWNIHTYIHINWHLPIEADDLSGIQLGETDFAAQARITAAQVARGAQTGARSAAEGFNRFVEGTNGPGSGSGSGSGSYRTVPMDESKRDFWDSFAEAGNRRPGASAIGTSAMKKTTTTGGGGMGAAAGSKKDEDNWDKW